MVDVDEYTTEDQRRREKKFHMGNDMTENAYATQQISIKALQRPKSCINQRFTMPHHQSLTTTKSNSSFQGKKRFQLNKHISESEDHPDFMSAMYADLGSED